MPASGESDMSASGETGLSRMPGQVVGGPRARHGGRGRTAAGRPGFITAEADSPLAPGRTARAR
ncbi:MULTISPECIES: hypothetical protein [Streptosporangium]|uniref:Uncharacterized protein n=1 Tax=Streptosporangium brasiliense TaxID=47480 RepID=A0ABT9RG16_9ACTN|nr:hypothetical protein [Streptosporangium brasiliense]MDP9867305.1 hypothetical protein [Streptosporangium brasiliense]